MLWSAYKESVMAAYDERLAAQSLPSELLLPTPANIKAEILKICEQGLSANDEQILRSFVGQKPDVNAYHKAFSIMKADPFRPLVNFLGDRSIDTNPRNIDLLALLIDYKPRPFHPNLTVPPNAGIPANTYAPVIEPVVPPQIAAPIHPAAQHEPPQTKKSSKKPMLFAATILIVAIVGVLLFQPWRKHYTGHERYMIWDDDHFKPVESNDQSNSAEKINWQLVNDFKRITKPDTMTLYSVRKVYYAKDKGNIFFFTGNGPDPLDTSKRLLPMTDYILKKYVYHILN